jgi:hypothetical protein
MVPIEGSDLILLDTIREGMTPMPGPVLVRRTKCSTLEYLEFFGSNTIELWSLMLTAHIAKAMIKQDEIWLLDG